MDKEIDEKFARETIQLENNVSSLENLFHQVCFCKNHMDDWFANANYITQFKGHEEIFGFTKPRMWERYAEKLNIPLIEMVWEHDSFNPQDYKGKINMFKELNS